MNQINELIISPIIVPTKLTKEGVISDINIIGQHKITKAMGRAIDIAVFS
jgi:hypothetical protein